MSTSFQRRLTELNPWLSKASPDAPDSFAAARFAAHAARLQAGVEGWNSWADAMAGLRGRARTEADMSAFNAAALVDLSPWREVIDLYGHAFPGDLRLEQRKDLERVGFEAVSVAGDFVLSKLRFDDGVHLQSSRIAGDFVIADCVFESRNDLTYLRVGGRARIERSKFFGGAWHQHSVFAGDALWSDVDFFSDAAFHHVGFGAAAHFQRVNFFDTTGFEQASFGAPGRCDGVKFYKKCFFAGASGALPAFLRPTASARANSGSITRLSTRRARKDAS
ncbi:MAG: hypothetical protein MRY74_01080 [Neomegalonema sp.]|nr:hypothetical protein [Neomegalonema sp.]